MKLLKAAIYSLTAFTGFNLIYPNSYKNKCLVCDFNMKKAVGRGQNYNEIIEEHDNCLIKANIDAVYDGLYGAGVALFYGEVLEGLFPLAGVFLLHEEEVRENFFDT